MALIGDLTIYEHEQSETETIIIDIEYASDIPADHPDFEKSGTVEQQEIPKIITTSTEYDNCYVIVQAITSWKHIVEDKTQPLFNITYRIYNSLEDRNLDYESYIYQDFIQGQIIDYSSSKSEISQAYDLVNNLRGFEELIND